MPVHVCVQCGAAYEQADDSCAERFSILLGLDHSRQEPWGSRHGSAFAAYTLQHPSGQSLAALERCWALLYRIWIAGDDPQYVARTLRQLDAGIQPSWIVPPLPGDIVSGAARRPRMTIVDLETFDARDYAARLEDWCRATLESLGQPWVAA